VVIAGLIHHLDGAHGIQFYLDVNLLRVLDVVLDALSKNLPAQRGA
jgi:hypothetical protein